MSFEKRSPTLAIIWLQLRNILRERVVLSTRFVSPSVEQLHCSNSTLMYTIRLSYSKLRVHIVSALPST